MNNHTFTEKHIQTIPMIDAFHSSYGEIQIKEDLYSQKIFGPLKNYACVCGKYDKPKENVLICDCCGVRIAPNALSLRKERMGHIKFPLPCKHPIFTNIYINTFLIAPIYYRYRNEDKTITKLGIKYENLFDHNDLIKTNMTDLNNDPMTYLLSKEGKNVSEDLHNILKDIVGNINDNIIYLDEETLIGIMNKSIFMGENNIPLFLHLMGMDILHHGKL